MKKLTIEETKEINGGVTTKLHLLYWSAFCGYCGSEWVAFGMGSGAKMAAIEKAHLCELNDAESWANY